LENADVPVADDGGYGMITGVELRRPAEYGNWLIATTSLTIPYGIDRSLYVFELRGNSWKHVLTLESNGYQRIYDAQGWLRYAVAGPIRGGKPYLVTTEVTPSPASIWQGLRLNVLRVGEKPDRPVRLVRRMLSYCIKGPYHVATRPDGFELIYPGNAVALPGFVGLHYLKYRIGVDGATLVKEAAVDPSSLVEKWANTNWAIASRSLTGERETAQQWHQRLRELGWGCGLGGLQLGVQDEREGKTMLASAPCEHVSAKKPSAFAILRASDAGIHVVSISTSEPAWAAVDESAGMVYRTGGPGLTDPVLVSAVQPVLPAGTRVGGSRPLKVRLRLVIGEEGSVLSVGVGDWPANERLLVPAIRAARQWKFTAARRGGKAVKASMTVDVVFK